MTSVAITIPDPLPVMEVLRKSALNEKLTPLECQVARSWLGHLAQARQLYCKRADFEMALRRSEAKRRADAILTAQLKAQDRLARLPSPSSFFSAEG